MVIEILMIVATFLASVVALLIALFGKAMENAVYHPIISIRLRNKEGELTKDNCDIKHRYYHLVIENKSSKIAHNAVPMLKKIETNLGGKVVSLWEGSELPLNWQFGNETKLFRNIGAKQKNNVDLLSVCKNELIIRTLFFANSMPPKENPGRWNSGQEMNIICTVYLKYDEGVSKDYKVKIFWDGKWEEDTLEMQKHLFISPM